MLFERIPPVALDSLERLAERLTMGTLFALALLVGGTLSPQATAAQSQARSSESLTDAYRTDAGRILGAALVDDAGWDKLEYLTTVIGHRLSGSKGLEDAIEWAAQGMQDEGLEISLQPVDVPHWVRGEESLEMLEPTPRSLDILGLGLSVGTPESGIEAEVVVVRNWAELDALPHEQVAGKIVLYAVPWSGYGSVVQYRSGGASRAAAKGAVAALVRSATGRSLYTPHTGALAYAIDQPKIPAAAVTVEDAEWIARLAERGETVRVRLKMDAQQYEDAESFNLIAEIRGRELPDEVVVMGGHYDSWDVGDGAHDDGAACTAAWHALTLIHQLGLQPRRTLRVVLWTNEENGLRGGNAYRFGLSEEELGNHVVAIEMDGGAERPIGFGFTLPGAGSGDPRDSKARATLEQIASFFEPIDAAQILPRGGGADIGPLMRSGVPGMSLQTVGEHYFDWHHTRADTLDKVDRQDFRRAVALFGVMGYVLADLPERLVPEV